MEWKVTIVTFGWQRADFSVARWLFYCLTSASRSSASKAASFKASRSKAARIAKAGESWKLAAKQLRQAPLRILLNTFRSKTYMEHDIFFLHFFPNLIMYWVSQQVWNQLRNVCKQSKHRLQKKVCIMLLKIAFSAFFVNCKIKNGFFSNFSPISNNLLNKLLHKIIGEQLLKNSIFNFAVHKKG